MSILVRLLKYLPDVIKDSGLSFITIFKILTLIIIEPNLEQSAIDKTSNFIYAMY